MRRGRHLLLLEQLLADVPIDVVHLRSDLLLVCVAARRVSLRVMLTLMLAAPLCGLRRGHPVEGLSLRVELARGLLRANCASLEALHAREGEVDNLAVHVARGDLLLEDGKLVLHLGIDVALRVGEDAPRERIANLVPVLRE